MSTSIPETTYNKIHQIIKENPTLSNEKIGQKLGIGKDAVRKWRARPEYPSIDEPTLITLEEDSRCRAENKELKRRLNEAIARETKHRDIFRLHSKAAASELNPPDWTRTKSADTDKAIATAFLSDLHLDEVVLPAQVQGVNAYNRRIAETRLQKFFESTLQLTFDHMKGISIEGLVLPMGGDMFSGNIHEELKITNESTILESILHWSGRLTSGVRMLAREFKKVHIPCVVGNHGRQSYKPIAKNRAQDNFDWLLYHIIARELAGERNVTFDISEAADTMFSIYETTFLLTHGDQFRGGGGIAGLLSPLMIGAHRKSKRQTAIGNPFNTLICGHWHQYSHFKGIIVNGCFTGNTIIQTLTGAAPIDSINVGEYVLSRDGSYQQVSHKFTKQSNDGLVHLKVRGLPEPVTATPNHLIWGIKAETKGGGRIGKKWDCLSGGADKPQWIPIDFLSAGDWVNVPRSTVGTATTIDKDHAWAIGLYLAEGSTLLDGGKSGKHNRIALTMHEKELSQLERWASIFERIYSHKPKVYLRKRNGLTSEAVVSPGREVCAHYRAEFGHRAAGKYLPPWVFNLAPSLCRAVVQGWVDGDGHTTAEGITSATTISKNLAYGMFRLALTAGLMPSMAYLAAGGPRKSTAYTIHFNSGQECMEVDGELFYRVHARYRTAEVTTVFDLEVGGEHTYAAGLIGAHNSLKGLDEYAFINNFDYEPPRQAYWLTQPKHGITISGPLHVLGKNERYS